MADKQTVHKGIRKTRPMSSCASVSSFATAIRKGISGGLLSLFQHPLVRQHFKQVLRRPATVLNLVGEPNDANSSFSWQNLPSFSPMESQSKLCPVKHKGKRNSWSLKIEDRSRFCACLRKFPHLFILLGCRAKFVNNFRVNLYKMGKLFREMIWCFLFAIRCQLNTPDKRGNVFKPL